MEVSVETLEGLRRRVLVSIPTEQVEQQVDVELKKVAKNVEEKGFRRGNVPFHLVKQRYSQSVRVDVAKGLLDDTFSEALKKHDLSPVTSPSVDTFEVEEGKDFHYAISFEVYPEVTLNEFQKDNTVEVVAAKISAADVDAVLEKMRQQHRTWEVVTRASKDGDKVKFDFTGYVDDKPFDRGAAKDFELELGSKQMIPGFEEGLVGHKAGEKFSIDVTFPEEYNEASLAGKASRFDIVLHEVLAGSLPAVDADFVKKIGSQEETVEALRADLEKQMTRELTAAMRRINHARCFKAFAAINPIDLPNGLIDKEIANLKHEFYHEIFGAEHSDHEKIPDFPREMFEDRANQRVHYGLLLSEYLKKHRLVVDDKKVEELLDEIASAYENPEAFKRSMREHSDRMMELESIVIERMVVESLLSAATVKENKWTYEQVMKGDVAQDNKESVA